MNNLTTYITEKLKISRKSKFYTCQPKTREELREILRKRLAKDKNADLNDIDVSEIIDMRYLFFELDPHNIDISEWDVSNVKNMEWIFRGCENFNSDLSKWDVSKVEDMDSMFYKCKKFNGDLSNWNVKKVKYMKSMFEDCDEFEGKGLENWNISSAEDTGCMFSGCKKFDCDLCNWDVSNVGYMNWMFYKCDSLKKKPNWYKMK